MTTPYMRYPFAYAGDLTAVPQTVQVDGSISYPQGYGPNYELDPTVNPSSLEIERKKMNNLFNDITTILQQYQQFSVPEFITSAMNGGTAFSYAKGARVRYNPGSGTGVYVSLVDSNTTDPTNTTNWVIDNGIVYGTNYIKYPSGIIMQWGISANTGVATTVTLPVSYISSYYILMDVQNGSMATPGTFGYYFADGTKTLSSFKWGCTNYTSGIVSTPGSNVTEWLTIGR